MSADPNVRRPVATHETPAATVGAGPPTNGKGHGLTKSVTKLTEAVTTERSPTHRTPL
ncbi:MAG: hypothetical protein OEQ39_10485 [Gammaproteobacteria bacterium]|nr:hypothetical protein [Gammaproteobacteria bacterium]MDH3467450.1 hypothetical protein [Gammaproteobacteria bacterium]